MSLRAAEFFGTLMYDTGDVTLVVMGKGLQTLRRSCQVLPVLGPLRSQERPFISSWAGFLFPSQAAFICS